MSNRLMLMQCQRADLAKRRYCLLLCLLLALSTQAQQHDFWVLTSLEPPFTQFNERGHLEGYSIDLVNGILHEAAIDQQILAAPWERVFKEASSKDDVLVFALARTPAREEHFHWISPVSSNIIGMFSLTPVVEEAQQLAQLDLSQSIGVLDGDFRLQLLQQAGASQIVVVESWQRGVQDLLEGQIQNLFFSSVGIQMLCARLQRECHDIHRVLSYQQVTSYIALSKGSNAQSVALLKEAAMRYKASADFIQMANKWIDRYQTFYGLSVHMDKEIMKLWPKPTDSTAAP